MNVHFQIFLEPLYDKLMQGMSGILNYQRFGNSNLISNKQTHISWDFSEQTKSKATVLFMFSWGPFQYNNN